MQNPTSCELNLPSKVSKGCVRGQRISGLPYLLAEPVGGKKGCSEALGPLVSKGRHEVQMAEVFNKRNSRHSLAHGWVSLYFSSSSHTEQKPLCEWGAVVGNQEKS